jgi:pyruvate dehydrogenase E1 component alpha subunit
MANKSVDTIDSTSTNGERGVVETSSGRTRQPQKLIDLDPIEELQILTPDGRVKADLDPDLPDDELMRIYRAMVLTRKFDVRMLNMQRQGQMGTFAPNLGQEATQIGQVYPLTRDDWYAPSYRSFGAQIWRGWPMERLMLLWDGYFEGFPPPDDVNDYPFSIVIGSHVPPAVGTAMAMKHKGRDTVMLTNFGDGAASEGAVAEALNFAAVFEAPCIFVLENNGYAISTTIEMQTKTKHMALRGVGYGVPSMRVDGNDVLAMIVASSEAVARARAGEGPTLIEAVTYRLSLHTTADDPKVYRDDAEAETWKTKCPIRRFETYLAGKGLLDDADIERIAGECEQEVTAARDRFREQAKANPREVFDFVSADMPAELREQQREYFEKLDRHGVE